MDRAPNPGGLTLIPFFPSQGPRTVVIPCGDSSPPGTVRHGPSCGRGGGDASRPFPGGSVGDSGRERRTKKMWDREKKVLTSRGGRGILCPVVRQD